MKELNGQEIVAGLHGIGASTDDAEWRTCAVDAVELIDRQAMQITSLQTEIEKLCRQIREDDEMIHTLLGIADGLTQVLERIVTES